MTIWPPASVFSGFISWTTDHLIDLRTFHTYTRKYVRPTVRHPCLFFFSSLLSSKSTPSGRGNSIHRILHERVLKPNRTGRFMSLNRESGARPAWRMLEHVYIIWIVLLHSESKTHNGMTLRVFHSTYSKGPFSTRENGIGMIIPSPIPFITFGCTKERSE